MKNVHDPQVVCDRISRLHDELDRQFRVAVELDDARDERIRRGGGR